MGGLGQTMIVRRIAAAAVISLGLVLGAVGSRAAGLQFGCEVVSLDITGTLSQVPVALSAGSDALLAMLADQGIPPSDLAGIEADFDRAIADLTVGLSSMPPLVPLPLLGGGIEIPLPLVVIDAVRVSGGILDTAIVRSIAEMAGAEIPDPLLDQTIDLGVETARLTADLEVSAWNLTAEAVKRLDLWLIAFDLSAGFGYATGALAVDIEHDLPAEWAAGVDSALAALQLDEVRWSAFTASLGGRLELGLPFLRVYAEVRLVQPVAEWVGWWDLHVGGWAGSVGVVIRF